MEHITYDDEGNPITIHKARRPPRKTRSHHRIPEVVTNLTAIFEIEGGSYDVVLEGSTITWTPVNISAKGSKTKKSRASIMKKLRGVKSMDSLTNGADPNNTLEFRDMIGVQIKRIKRDASSPGVCQGIEMHVHDKKGPNRYKLRMLLLVHPSEDICAVWVNKINEGLKDFTERPKKLKVFLQAHAGKNQGKSMYNNKIAPLFEAAGIAAEVTEVEHNEHIKQQFIHMDIRAFDCVVCVGGDGTVHRVMNGLLSKVQQDEGSDMRITSTVYACPVALGIIPTGLVNQIVHSIHGIEDPLNAAIHIILGHKKPVNVCAIYHQEKIHRWAFNAHYGFFGNVVPFLGRHTKLGDRKVDYAVLKALTKKRFKNYEADVQYIAADADVGTVTKGGPCTLACTTCELDPLGQSRLSSYSDDVQELDPLTASSTSSTIIDLSKEVPWKSIKGEFIDVGLFSLPGLCDLSPRGASPYTHVNDGHIDIIIVRPTERKEFIRYLKRHGNAKNQFDFPFIETIRCKEVNFHIRLKETWNHKDYGFNEIEYEMERQEKQSKPKLSRAQSVDVIEELCLEYSDDDEKVQNSDDSDDGTETSEGASRTSSANKGAQGERRSAYRPTYQDMHREARNKKLRKKDEKKKAEAEASMKSLWNLDNEVCLDLDLHFKIHQSLLCIYGQGVSEDTEYEETKYNCLAMK